MSYNTRRSAGGEGVNTVGSRRNPVSNNFVPGGQLANRPPLNHGPRGPFNQSNGNIRPQGQQQQQRGPGQMQQQRPPIQNQPQVVKQEQQPQQQKQQPQPQQQQQQQQQAQAPAPAPAPAPMAVDAPAEDPSVTEDSAVKKRPWMNNLGKISKRERQRRRNLRLSKMLQPKNAVMILNELVRNPTYSVTDVPQHGDVLHYTATVHVEGTNHIGNGRSKIEAKNQAAEAALKHIVKTRQFTPPSTTDADGDVKMEVADDAAPPPLPWQHVASFAIYKLLNSWGEDPNQAQAQAQTKKPPHQSQSSENLDQLPQNKPAKKLPDNAAQMNPIMLLNQMLPHVQFEETDRVGSGFSFRCVVDGKTFTGTGTNKKAAKKMAAYAVCGSILGIQYPPEVLSS